MRYSYEYKRKCVELYQQGKWPDTPYGIKERNFRNMIYRWARMEFNQGVESLIPKKHFKKWTPEEKLELISQVIAQKQNKTQTELGTVDGENGSAAQSQKMMTWMMPIMFGFFSFMYTASFSIYIIISSVFSMGANFIINKLVDLKFARLAAEEAKKHSTEYLLEQIKELLEKQAENK